MKQVVFFILLLLSNIAVAQNTPATGTTDNNTGNLIYSTVNPPPQGSQFNWSGFINNNTSGGGFSGGNIPAYNSQTGTFIFGYAQGTVSYSTAISSINFGLAAAGSNIQIKGFRYSWEYYNQDMSRGTLTTNINLTSSSNQVLQNFNYNLVKTTSGWTKMSGTESFATPYLTSDLGNLNVTFTGKDDRFWAGYYGPQIRDFGVSLTYSVASAPAPSPTPTPTPTPVPTNNTNTNTNTTVVAEPTATAAEPQPTATVSTVDTTQTTTSPTTTSTTPTALTTSSNSTNTATATSTPLATASSVSTSSSSSSRSTVDGTSIGLSVVSRNQQREQSIAMQAVQSSLATAEQATQQTQQEALSVASQAVSNSFAVAQSATKTTSSSTDIKTAANNTDLTFQNNQSAQSVSLFASPTTQTTQRQADNNQSNISTTTPTVAQQTTRTNQTNQQIDTSNTTGRTNIAVVNTSPMSTDNEVKPPIPIVQAKASESVSTPVATTTETTTQQQTTYSLLPPVVSTITQTSVIQSFKLVQDRETTIAESSKLQELNVSPVANNFSIMPPRQETQQPVIQNAIASNTQNNISTSLPTNQPIMLIANEFSMADSQKMLLDRSNPLFQTLENKLTETQNNNTLQQGPTVNRNAQNNEVAGGVDLTRMAQVPAGYNEYLNFTLRDAAFYPPKEVYRNQKVIDNARALRQLSSDRLHQQMVNAQYERK